MKEFILFILFLFSYGDASCQSTEGNIMFRLYPLKEGLLIQVNDSVYQYPVLTLPEGTHEFTIWAPDRITIDTVLSIYPDSTVVFQSMLPHHPVYREYRKSLASYRWRVSFPKYSSYAVSGGLTVFAALSYIDVRRKWNAVLDGQSFYEQSLPSDIQIAKSLLDERKEAYDKGKRSFYTLSFSALASWGVSLLIFEIINKERKPKYTSAPPPFNISLSLMNDYPFDSNGFVLNYFYSF